MVRMLLVVTGASRGLGRCIAKAFHEENYKIESISAHLIARSAENLEQTRREILQAIEERHARRMSASCTQDDGLQTKISIHPMDLGDLDTLEEQMGAVFEEMAINIRTTDFDRFVLINNHGTLGHLGPCLDERASLANMQRAVNLNVTSSLWISVMASRFVQKYCGGSLSSSSSSSSCPKTMATIVNISSLAALQPFPTMAVYASGKAVRDLNKNASSSRLFFLPSLPNLQPLFSKLTTVRNRLATCIMLVWPRNYQTKTRTRAMIQQQQRQGRRQETFA